MTDNHETITNLTCGEIASLWETYQFETLSYCGIMYFLQHVEDEEIKTLLKKTLEVKVKRIEKVKELLTEEGHSIPVGFTEGDVNLKAPRLFSDELYLDYLLHTFQMEFYSYNWSMVTAVKLSIQQFYKKVMQDTMQLEMEAKELSKQKGLFVKAPEVPTIKHVSYVKKDSFLTGWFGKRRPLLATEISEMVFNAKRNVLGHAVITAFSQVTETKEVRDFFIKGRDISEKNVRVFTDKLKEDYLPSAVLGKIDQVTTSTESPFSERLMMNFITTLIASSIGEYGLSMSMSPRHDIGVMYTRLIAEIAAYANEGANIMINNAWMEEPPMAADRKKLVNRNE